MNSERIKVTGACVLAVSFLAGCAASTTPRTDEKFGEAVNVSKAQQIINPDASQSMNPVKGIDGQAAKSSVDNYHKAYETPTSMQTGTIGTIGVMGTTLK